MNFAEYQEKAKRTMNNSLDEKRELAVLALGLSGEMGEVLENIQESMDPINYTKDELGDVSWYTANLYSWLGEEWVEPDLSSVRGIYGKNAYKLSIDGTIIASRIADLVKKTVGQGHELPKERMVSMLDALTIHIYLLALSCGLDFIEVLEYNVNVKLAKRYPDGFESTRSIKR